MTEQERTDAITTAKKMDTEQLVKDVQGIIDGAQKIIHMIETAD